MAGSRCWWSRDRRRQRLRHPWSASGRVKARAMTLSPRALVSRNRLPMVYGGVPLQVRCALADSFPRHSGLFRTGMDAISCLVAFAVTHPCLHSTSRCLTSVADRGSPIPLTPSQAPMRRASTTTHLSTFTNSSACRGEAKPLFLSFLSSIVRPCLWTCLFGSCRTQPA
jgi:hypothetical protein